MTDQRQDPSAAPTRLGRYDLLGEIASGGMATVFLARSWGKGGFSRLVAIKRLHPHLESEEDFVKMFLDEARLAARIRHPNVVGTLDVEDKDGLYLVMEYIEGVTLLQLTRMAARVNERVPVPVGARVVLDVLAGLHAAHELRDEHDAFLNLVHRDVSPQNILLGVDGTARLTDFGIAKATSRLSMTRDGQLKGKISYMAPEQTRRNDALDRRADVFAMGIVAWEVFAGRRLFTGESDVEVLNQLMFEPIPRLRDHAPTLPSMLEQTVMRALERDVEKRYATAAQFSEAVERATRMLGGPANHRVVAAFVQKIAGERIARERARIASGSPERPSEIPPAPASQVRPAANANADRPSVAPRAKLRAPTMTGPVYKPVDELRAKPAGSLRPPTMPSPSLPPTRPATTSPSPGGERPSSPPAVIEFDLSEESAYRDEPSPLRAPTPAPIAPRPMLSGAAVDPEAVTRVAAQPITDVVSEPSLQASLLLGTPASASVPPGQESNPDLSPISLSYEPPPPASRAPPSEPPAAPSVSDVPVHQELPPTPAVAPIASPSVPWREVAPAPPAAVAAPVDEAPAKMGLGVKLLAAVAVVAAMALGGAVALYLTGQLAPRPPVEPPRAHAAEDASTADAQAVVADDVATADAGADAAADARDDAEVGDADAEDGASGGALDATDDVAGDALAQAVDAQATDAEEVGADASEEAAGDAAPAAEDASAAAVDAARRHRHRHHHHDEDEE